MMIIFKLSRKTIPTSRSIFGVKARILAFSDTHCHQQISMTKTQDMASPAPPRLDSVVAMQDVENAQLKYQI
jgi:hypothetical protein